MKLIPILAWVFFSFNGYLRETSAKSIAPKAYENIQNANDYNQEIAAEIKKNLEQTVLKKLTEYPLAEGINDEWILISEQLAALFEFEARTVGGDEEMLNRTREQFHKDIDRYFNENKMAFQMFHIAALKSAQLYDIKMNEEKFDGKDDGAVKRAHKRFKSEAIELFQKIVEGQKFNETSIKELIEVYKYRLEQKIDANLSKFILIDYSFDAYQTAAKKSVDYYLNTMRYLMKENENYREMEVGTYEADHERTKTGAIAQALTAGPNYKTVAKYFEGYIEQEAQKDYQFCSIFIYVPATFYPVASYHYM